MVRLLQMGVVFGSLLAAALFLGASVLPSFFSSDHQVTSQAARVLPFVAAFLVSRSSPEWRPLTVEMALADAIRKDDVPPAPQPPFL